MNRRLFCLLGALLAISLLGAGPTGNDEENSADEALLKLHKLPSDGDSLLAFFRKRTLSDETRRRLEGLVKKLGDASFPAREEAERELIAFWDTGGSRS